MELLVTVAIVAAIAIGIGQYWSEHSERRQRHADLMVAERAIFARRLATKQAGKPQRTRRLARHFGRR